MKILLLGGTGVMGNSLSKILANKEIDTHITSRSKRQNKKNITYILGNAHDLSFLKKILSNNYDAIIDFMSYKTIKFAERFNLFLNATPQYVFISTCRVYAESKEKITEESPLLLDSCNDKKYLKTDEYALTKARQELLLKNSGKTNWTIIRPPKTYGKDRLQLGCLEKDDWLQRALSGKEIIFSKEIASKILHFTSGDDLARAIFALIGEETAKGEIFHVTTDNFVTWTDVLNLYLDVLEKHLGHRPNVKYIPLNSFMKYHYNSEYQIKYSALIDRKFDNSKIANFIDTSSFTIIHEGLKNCLEAFLNAPTFKPIGKASLASQNILLKESSIKDYLIIIASKIKQIIR